VIPRLGDVKAAVRIRKPLQVCQVLRLVEPELELPLPDAQEQLVLYEAVEILRKCRVCWIDPSHQPDDDRVVLGDVEPPEVVLEPRARLDDDRANDAEG
jgi:hypothetical protein